MSRSIMQELHAILDEAILSWKGMSNADEEAAPEVDDSSPKIDVPGLVPIKNRIKGSRSEPAWWQIGNEGSHLYNNQLANPEVGLKARYNYQWQQYAREHKVNPGETVLDSDCITSSTTSSTTTPWWMEHETQYGLLDPEDQVLLEDTAKAALMKRGYAPSTQRAFGREVRETQNQTNTDSRRRIGFDGNYRDLEAWRKKYTLRKREYKDAEFDRHFWARNLRSEDIYGPREQPWVDLNDDLVSPHSTQVDFGMVVPKPSSGPSLEERAAMVAQVSNKPRGFFSIL
ncbi:hypothetical protein B0H63DRAFT_524627 [Podospora didyma]|uniref:Uncharacterized protein n=1 Tax=Podospora didyma TaxID=330526 RepID=A0AAE0NI33_9PEZI|nr:hypothetical protein B0H63DRAFT_524627 [Podospora didyma]